MTDFIVIIPARMASSRLPNKPLADIVGKPMVVRVADQAKKSKASRVVIAADHPAIITACEYHGHEALLTCPNHASGTDRLAEAASMLELSDNHLIINVQGDEPLIEPELINHVAGLLENSKAEMATAAHLIEDVGDFVSPDVVKVVIDHNGYALYFSRAQIPWKRNNCAQGISKFLENSSALRHIGIYGYSAEFLRCYAQLEPSPLELIESLEQLRVLWHGYKIAVEVIEYPTVTGVDTLQDLERVRSVFSTEYSS